MRNGLPDLITLANSELFSRVRAKFGSLAILSASMPPFHVPNNHHVLICECNSTHRSCQLIKPCRAIIIIFKCYDTNYIQKCVKII